MSEVDVPTGLEGKDLYQATRQFAEETTLKSWWYTLTTLVLQGIILTSAGIVSWWPGRLGLSILGGLLIVRSFVLFHDHMHGALLGNSRIAKAIFHLYGLIWLTPPRAWRHSHNFHHANVGKPIQVKQGEFSLLTSDIGAVPLMTIEMWRKATFWQRWFYRINRHPLTIMLAYVTVFLYSLCLSPMLANPRKFWDGALSILLHGGVLAVLWIFAGFQTSLFAFILPFTIASALGAYLFFAQHNFRGMQLLRENEWSHFRAALASSSYLKLGPIMNWFTANVGYHHVHHLNSRIPFYRLPEAMAAIPELKLPIVTTLRPRDILDCLRLNLWDTKTNQLVTYREAA